MSITLDRDSVVVLRQVSWDTYSVLRDQSENRHVRMTYDHGDLFLMSPGRLHERIGELLAQLICVWTEQRGIARLSSGSTTMRSMLVERGFEPDKSFYIQNEQFVRQRDEYDADRDPPPDLTIEVDVTSLSSVRMPIYAQFGVPEVWRWFEDALHIHRLEGNEYQVINQSVCLPGFPIEEATAIVNRRHEQDETRLISAFRKIC